MGWGPIRPVDSIWTCTVLYVAVLRSPWLQMGFKIWKLISEVFVNYRPTLWCTRWHLCRSSFWFPIRFDLSLGSGRGRGSCKAAWPHRDGTGFVPSAFCSFPFFRFPLFYSVLWGLRCDSLFCPCENLFSWKPWNCRDKWLSYSIIYTNFRPFRSVVSGMKVEEEIVYLSHLKIITKIGKKTRFTAP